MTVEEILEKLVSFRSVAGEPNGAITDWICGYLTGLGAEVHRIPIPEGDRWNLFASFGPADAAGLVLSGHMDVVPAQEPDWRSDPFTLTASDGRFYGRGTSDMKGYLACILAAAPQFASLARDRPIHIALSCDEELGCQGVPWLLARLPELCAPPAAAVIGEPTGLVPVRGHKGKAALRVGIEGRSGHSSRTDTGLNAIHAMSGILGDVVALSLRLQEGPKAADFVPAYSTMQAGVISGGQALNIIPGQCTMLVEARAIPGVDPQDLLGEVLRNADALREQGYTVDQQVFASYPALSLAADHPLVAHVEACSGRPAQAAVSFGTEAGLFQQAGIPAIVCGPGDIDRAHKANEYITRDELSEGLEFVQRLVRRAESL